MAFCSDLTLSECKKPQGFEGLTSQEWNSGQVYDSQDAAVTMIRWVEITGVEFWSVQILSEICDQEFWTDAAFVHGWRGDRFQNGALACDILSCCYHGSNMCIGHADRRKPLFHNRALALKSPRYQSWTLTVFTYLHRWRVAPLQNGGLS